MREESVKREKPPLLEVRFCAILHERWPMLKVSRVGVWFTYFPWRTTMLSTALRVIVLSACFASLACSSSSGGDGGKSGGDATVDGAKKDAGEHGDTVQIVPPRGEARGHTNCLWQPVLWRRLRLRRDVDGRGGVLQDLRVH